MYVCVCVCTLAETGRVKVRKKRTLPRNPSRSRPSGSWRWPPAIELVVARPATTCGGKGWYYSDLFVVCARMCVHACVHARMCACVYACVHVCAHVHVIIVYGNI